MGRLAYNATGGAKGGWSSSTACAAYLVQLAQLLRLSTGSAPMHSRHLLFALLASSAFESGTTLASLSAQIVP